MTYRNDPPPPAIRFCSKHGPWKGLMTDTCPSCLPLIKSDEDLAAHVVVAGVDLARYRDYSALCALDIFENVATVKALKIWPHVDYAVIVDEVRDLYVKKHIRVVAVDQTGAGESVVEHMKGIGMAVEGIKFTLTTKQEMVEYARDLMQKHMLVIPDRGKNVPELKAQIAEQERRVGAAQSRAFGSETVKFDHPQGRHDDLLWAFLMACYIGRNWLTQKAFWLPV